MIFHTKESGSEISVSTLMPALTGSAYEKFFGTKSSYAYRPGMKMSSTFLFLEFRLLYKTF